ncbi:MAG: hypothetical protein LAT51_01785 [Flavobacteriaceae bacterium]|nr:hypothetical protein [Flavobacteriaceae bacterium]
MKQEKNNQYSDEVDLGYLLSKIGNFFKKIAKAFVYTVDFYLNYKWIVLGLLVVGVVGGYFLETSTPSKSKIELVVEPNYDTHKLFYNAIENIPVLLQKQHTDDQAKQDLIALFGEDYAFIRSVDIKPLRDFNYLMKGEEFVEMIETLSEIKDLDWIFEDLEEGFLNKQHLLEIVVVDGDGLDKNKIAQNLINYFNQIDYLQDYRKVSLTNTQYLLTQNDKSITQIDSVMHAAGSLASLKSIQQGVLLSDNSQLANLLEQKTEILDQRFELFKKVEMQDQVIEVVHVNSNAKFDSAIASLSKTILLPFLLIFGFSVLMFFRFTYRKLKSYTHA